MADKEVSQNSELRSFQYIDALILVIIARQNESVKFVLSIDSRMGWAGYVNQIYTRVCLRYSVLLGLPGSFIPRKITLFKNTLLKRRVKMGPQHASYRTGN